MMLDVDFAVCTDWRSKVRDAVAGRAESAGGELLSPRPSKNETLRREVFEKLRAGTAALVLPAFEYAKQEDGVDQTTFPQDKQVAFSFLLNACALNHTVRLRAWCVLLPGESPRSRCSTRRGRRDTIAPTTQSTSPSPRAQMRCTK